MKLKLLVFAVANYVFAQDEIIGDNIEQILPNDDIVNDTTTTEPMLTTNSVQITTTLLPTTVSKTVAATTAKATVSNTPPPPNVVVPPPANTPVDNQPDTVVKAMQNQGTPRSNVVNTANANTDEPLAPSADFVPGDMPSDTVIEPSVGTSTDNGNINATNKSEGSSSNAGIYAGVGVGVALLAFGGFIVKVRQNKKRDSYLDEEGNAKPRDLSMERFSVPVSDVSYGSRMRQDRMNQTSVAFTVDEMYRSSAAFSERTVATVPIDTLPKLGNLRDSVAQKMNKKGLQHPLSRNVDSVYNGGRQNPVNIRDSLDSSAFSEPVVKTPLNRDSASSYSFSEQSVRIDSTLWNELRDSRFDSFEATDAALAVAAAASLHASQDSNGASDKYDSMAISDVPNFFEQKH